MILVWVIAICVFFLYWHATSSSKERQDEDDDYTITNEHTWWKPMKSREYYAKIKSGQIVLPKSDNRWS